MGTGAADRQRVGAVQPLQHEAVEREFAGQPQRAGARFAFTEHELRVRAQCRRGDPRPKLDRQVGEVLGQRHGVDIDVERRFALARERRRRAGETERTAVDARRHVRHDLDRRLVGEARQERNADIEVAHLVTTAFRAVVEVDLAGVHLDVVERKARRRPFVVGERRVDQVLHAIAAVVVARDGDARMLERDAVEHRRAMPDRCHRHLERRGVEGEQRRRSRRARADRQAVDARLELERIERDVRDRNRARNGRGEPRLQQMFRQRRHAEPQRDREERERRDDPQRVPGETMEPARGAGGGG